MEMLEIPAASVLTVVELIERLAQNCCNTVTCWIQTIQLSCHHIDINIARRRPCNIEH
ncbi:hypothetical protein MA4S0726RB_4773 [Mycobacteroides abscessus 4S-0726-RB]|nr:hypothetical protein MA4S0726RB_4773 [Mycobacteroides abscessus 4S-0726-RB]EIU00966.1 hypothetical protein MA4S0726RA_0279 [Mycobacteroides abscessus 4S-0726-RA]EIU03208.1 hypothetical protein MA4S0303_0554 [Mycobacteroides abscessus 4S-0303]EIV10440.1 hypothetical protein MA4S0206_2007 [Mycobacteroides abscessus 4S-0206]EIV51874.1 hypothetical protein MA4S0116R_0546 [Mycobacteroides abscessus 4S-0116-R]EIV61402.1 hypothetical protein MA4S0116S_4314 [Mycobacteroides abscessus 4S-0116-S]